MVASRDRGRDRAAPSGAWLLTRDELIGFARSKVMIILWAVMPALALVGFLLLRGQTTGSGMSAFGFMSLLESSIASTVAALMIAVDLVSERNRNVYSLLVIRPIRREVIVWAKFLAVSSCVVVACAISLLLGLAVDWIDGRAPTVDSMIDLGRSLAMMIATVAMATAFGALFGTIARTILVAVILVLYVGQNVAVLPLIPSYLGLADNTFWLFMAISAVLVAGALALAAVAFRRAQL